MLTESFEDESVTDFELWHALFCEENDAAFEERVGGFWDAGGSLTRLVPSVQLAATLPTGSCARGCSRRVTRGDVRVDVIVRGYARHRLGGFVRHRGVQASVSSVRRRRGLGLRWTAGEGWGCACLGCGRQSGIELGVVVC